MCIWFISPTLMLKVGDSRTQVRASGSRENRGKWIIDQLVASKERLYSFTLVNMLKRHTYSTLQRNVSGKCHFSLMMKEKNLFEAFVHIYQTTRRRIPECSNLRGPRREGIVNISEDGSLSLVWTNVRLRQAVFNKSLCNNVSNSVK